MNEIAVRLRMFRLALRPALRTAIAIVLLGSICTEILPCAYVDSPPSPTGVLSGRSFAIEPLQVCDHGDSFLGVLSDLPVLLAGAPDALPAPEVRRLLPEDVALSTGQFHASIDRPPRTTA